MSRDDSRLQDPLLNRHLAQWIDLEEPIPSRLENDIELIRPKIGWHPDLLTPLLVRLLVLSRRGFYFRVALSIAAFSITPQTHQQRRVCCTAPDGSESYVELEHLPESISKWLAFWEQPSENRSAIINQMILDAA